MASVDGCCRAVVEPYCSEFSPESNSDCSSPTSWEFQGAHRRPGVGAMGLSTALSPTQSASSPCSKAQDTCRNNSSSSGSNSSTGSHRSADSGFSDFHIYRQQQQHLNIQAKNNYYRDSLNRKSERFSPRRASGTFIVKDHGEIFDNIENQRQFYEGNGNNYHHQTSQTMVNSSLLGYKQACCPHSPAITDDEERDSIYQEVILSRPDTSLISMPPDNSVDLGAPACCSTPKLQQQHQLKKTKMKKKDSSYYCVDKMDNCNRLHKNGMDGNNNNKYNADANGNLSSNVSYNNSTALHSGQDKDTFPVYSPGSSYCHHDTIDSYSPAEDATTTYTTAATNRWASLPKSFQKVPVKDNKKSQVAVVVKTQADNDALRLWLAQLRYQAEPECLYVLQSKSVSDVANSSENSTPPTMSLHMSNVSVPLMSIRNVEAMASVISGLFSKICKHLEFGFFAQVPPLVENLVDHLDEFLKQVPRAGGPLSSSLSSGSSPASFCSLNKLENRLASSCYELRMAAQTLIMLLVTSSSGSQQQHFHEHHQDLSHSLPSGSFGDESLQREFHSVVTEIVDGIVALGNLFGQVVDQRLTRDLSAILDTIEGGGMAGSVALKSFATILNDGGMHICRLAASIRTVRGLLGVLLDAKENNERILALRCLATILCVGEAVKDFDKAGGFEIVADILHDSRCSIVLKLEAVSVLAQATDPWIDLETSLMNLGYHLEKIIVSLTSMISYCHSHQDGFLLTIAAISNLTFLEATSLELLRRHRTVSLIINAIKAKPDFSIFVLDHVATVLANMSGAERCRKEIIRNGGIVTLLCFLQQRPLPMESAAEIAACERVQQKSTIAISRLCNEDGVAQMILEMGGMERMVQLCRQEKERNYSDGVLIACLATLRKLVTFCGEGAARGLSADDLIHPRLLDSFLMYSSRQESYV